MKSKCAFVFFKSTMDAINFESSIGTDCFGGRLIPVPSSISSDCGMCWIEPIEHIDSLKNFIRINNMEYDSIEILDY